MLVCRQGEGPGAGGACRWFALRPCRIRLAAASERECATGPLAIVSPRASALVARLPGRVVALADAPDVVAVARAGATLIGDVDEWQSRWGAIASLRGIADVVLEGCSTADYRAITRSRELPPPLDGRLGCCWCLEPDGSVSRSRLPLAETPQASTSASAT